MVAVLTALATANVVELFMQTLVVLLTTQFLDSEVMTRLHGVLYDSIFC